VAITFADQSELWNWTAAASARRTQYADVVAESKCGHRVAYKCRYANSVGSMSVREDKRTPNSPLKSLTVAVVVLSALVLYLLPQTTILNSRLLQIRQQLFRSFGTMAKVAPPRPIKLYSNSKYLIFNDRTDYSCPFAARSRFALAEANVDFEEVEIDLQNKPEWYLKIFPVSRTSSENLTIAGWEGPGYGFWRRDGD